MLLVAREARLTVRVKGITAPFQTWPRQDLFIRHMFTVNFKKVIAIAGRISRNRFIAV